MDPPKKWPGCDLYYSHASYLFKHSAVQPPRLKWFLRQYIYMYLIPRWLDIPVTHSESYEIMWKFHSCNYLRPHTQTHLPPPMYIRGLVNWKDAWYKTKAPCFRWEFCENNSTVPCPFLNQENLGVELLTVSHSHILVISYKTVTQFCHYGYLLVDIGYSILMTTSDGGESNKIAQNKFSFVNLSVHFDV